jgi:hypothetical protein
MYNVVFLCQYESGRDADIQQKRRLMSGIYIVKRERLIIPAK